MIYYVWTKYAGGRMPVKRQKRFIVRMEEDLLTEAQTKAAEDGHPLSVIVRRLLRAYVSGEVQITMELRKEDGDG